MIQEGLFARLSADAGVQALIGTNIFEVEPPPDLSQYPCGSYKCVGGSSGLGFDNSDVTRQRIELNGYSFNSYGEAAKIAAAMAAAIDGWTAALPDGNTVINTVSLNPGTDFVTEQRCFRCMREFYVDYTQPS